MFQAAVKSIKSVGRALLAVLAMSAFAAGSANADPCAEACRSQHNSCRMAAKLLFSSHCDAQLQSCITQCFSGARMREGRDARNPREGRPPDMRDGEPRGMGGDARQGEPRDMRGPPREFHDPRDQGGQRWLGSGDRR
ncbi:MAG: hypothetical protein JSS54_00230 [Proteobacteria bacterium]|nr:hypothetical protein [Pseudomonadota bacterium]